MKKNKNKNIYAGKRVIEAKAGKRQKLVKISEIAQAYELLPSTINFYTREGLLPEDARSPGGYRLYHRDKTIDRLRRIEDLQNKKRLTIQEIKRIL